MPLESQAIYVHLLCEEWIHGPLPIDRSKWGVVTGLPQESIEAAWAGGLSECFEESPAGWTNPRLELEREKGERKHRQKVEAGRRGGRAKSRNRYTQKAKNAESKVQGTEGVSSTATISLLAKRYQSQPHTQEEEQLSSKLNGADPTVREIFDYWADERASAIGKTSTVPMKMTTKRRSKIKARLAEGYSAEQLKRAIDGCCSNPHNVEGGYLDIELICRDQQHVEQYLRWSENNSTGPQQLIGLPPMGGA